jgi:hypothetical protein
MQLERNAAMASVSLGHVKKSSQDSPRKKTAVDPAVFGGFA